MLDKELALSRCQKECLCKAHQADGSPLYGARPAREKVRNMEILKKECSYQFFQMSQVPSLYASLCLFPLLGSECFSVSFIHWAGASVQLDRRHHLYYRKNIW